MPHLIRVRDRCRGLCFRRWDRYGSCPIPYSRIDGGRRLEPSALSMRCLYAEAGYAPIRLSLTVPFSKSMPVGMLMISYFIASPWLLSTLILTNLTLPSYSSDNASIVGAIMLHGPHQSA